jgi:hypothetical protein
MTVKNFNLAARKAAAKRPGAKRKDIPFQLETDGPTYHLRGDIDNATIEAISATFVRAQAQVGEDSKAAGQTASLALYRMLDNLFTPDTMTALWARIEDPKDRFNFDALGEVVEWAIEEAAGRPTTSSRT